MTPAQIADTYTAKNPMQNADYITARKYVEFFNSLNVPELHVVEDGSKGLGIVAIQQTSSSAPDGAQTTPFDQLRAMGIKENEFLYLHIARVSAKPPLEPGDAKAITYSCVAALRNLYASNGSPVEGAIQIISDNYQLQTGNMLSHGEADALLSGANSVAAAKQSFVTSTLGS